MDNNAFAARLNEMRIPHHDDLKGSPSTLQALMDRLNEFINGWPMLVTTVPGFPNQDLLRIETQDPENPKHRQITYVQPRLD